MENQQTDEFAESEGYRLAKEALKRRQKIGSMLYGIRPSEKTFEAFAGHHEAFLRGWMRAVTEAKPSISSMKRIR